MIEKSAAGTSCTLRISGLYCRHCEYPQQYFEVLHVEYCGYSRARSISGFATAVNTPCTSKNLRGVLSVPRVLQVLAVFCPSVAFALLVLAVPKRL